MSEMSAAENAGGGKVGKRQVAKARSSWQSKCFSIIVAADYTPAERIFFFFPPARRHGVFSCLFMLFLPKLAHRSSH